MKTIIVFILSISLLTNCNLNQQKKKNNQLPDSLVIAKKTKQLTNEVDFKNTTENASIEENQEQRMLHDFLKDKNGDVAKAKALPFYAQDSIAAICAICNYKFDQNALRKSDKSTVQKSITIEKGNTSQKDEITLHYQNNQVIRVAKRLLDENENVLKLDLFDIDENNNCFSRYQLTLEKKYSFYDAIYNGSVIRYDIYNKYFALSESQREEIIYSAKSSLDSIMKHFPEFTYSIKWK